jgi:hypothetical protein
VYELLALKDEQADAAGFEWVATYERAYDAFQRGEWRAALDGFRAVITARGSDGPSAHFARRCELKLEAPVASNVAVLPTNRAG